MRIAGDKSFGEPGNEVSVTMWMEEEAFFLILFVRPQVWEVMENSPCQGQVV